MKFLKRSEKPAIYYRDQVISHNELIARAVWLTKHYEATRGERVAILCENRPEWIYTFYSIWFQRAIPVPIDVQSTPDEIAYVLKDSTPTTIFCSAKAADNAKKAVELAGIPIRLNVLDELDFASAKDEGTEFPDAEMEDTAVIIYTSGTTGSPKGVMLSYTNLHANLYAVSELVKIYVPTDRLLVLLPLHHVLPLQGTLVMPLFLTAACVIAASMSGPDILDALNKHHVTMVIGVPRLYGLLRDSIVSKIRQNWFAQALFNFSKWVGNRRFSHFLFGSVQRKFGGAMRYMPCGGAALDPEIVRDFRALGFEILNGYGMSECAPMISFTRPDMPRDGSSGQLLPANEVRIVDGEITVHGDNVMKGYYNRPEETAEVLKDGWLYTGDEGYVDDDNYIFITGRKKEIIVLSNGKNINPDEIEQKLLLISPFISEAAVLPAGDVLEALILPNFKTLREAGVLNIEETIRNQVLTDYNQKVSSYKRIGKCTLVSEPLPKTRMGKIKHHELPALVASFANGTTKEKVPEPDTEEYRVIKKFLAEFTGQPVHPNDHFELDLNIDSLGKVAFLTFLDGTFDTEVTERMLLDNPTPAKLAEALKAQNSGPLAGKTFEWGTLLKENVNLTLPDSCLSGNGLNFLSRIALHCMFRLHGTGMENIPEGPCIFAPNHQSYLDGPFVTAYLKGRMFRDTFFYAKSDHDKSWGRRFLARHSNIIVMDVNNDLKQSIQKLASVLRQGKKIIVFPEGTRTLDGCLGSFKQMFAILCRELNVPVIPIAIDGAFEALPRTRFFPKFFQKVQVTFLPPITAKPDEEYASIVERTVAAIQPHIHHT